MSGNVSGTMVNAGVALLIPGVPTEGATSGMQLVTELASFLVRSGDSTMA